MPGGKLLPGEYRRRSLVTIEMDSMDAGLYAPEKLEELKRTRPGDLLDLVAVEEHYIITTHRLDGRWGVTVEHGGNTYRLPGKVIERILAQRESIIAEGRKDRGRQQARRRLAKVAKGDQADAEAAERARDLGGL